MVSSTALSPLDQPGAFMKLLLRRETTYSDFRRPDEVQFITDIHQDLSRRDGTINAMAYNPMEGLIDDHHGLQDLRARRICCVGNPQTRFQRGCPPHPAGSSFRFHLKFRHRTANPGLLFLPAAGCSPTFRRNGSTNELQKLLTGDGAVKICTEFSAVFSVFIPMTDAMKRGWALCAPLLSHLPKDLTSVFYSCLAGFMTQRLSPTALVWKKR